MAASEKSSDILLIVPAWYDPKRRSIVFDWSTFKLGAFCVARQFVYFVSVDGQISILSPHGAYSTAWPKWPTAKPCDVTMTSALDAALEPLPPATHRFYFVRPSDNVASAKGEKFFEEAAGMAETIGGVLALTGRQLASFGASAELVAQAAMFPGALSEYLEGRRNGERVRLILESLSRNE